MFLIKVDNSNYVEFTNTLAKLAYVLIYGVDPPRMVQEGEILIQISIDMKVGYWFLYEDHIITRIYGFQEEPYKPPPSFQ